MQHTQIVPKQAAAIAKLIDRHAATGEPGISFNALNWYGIHFFVYVDGVCTQRYNIAGNGSIYPYLKLDEVATRPEHKSIETELAEQGLRIAADGESGWYCTTTYGTIWATDLPLENEA
jgi:hypothetical protein